MARTVNDIMNLTAEDIEKMTAKELRETATILKSASNKRLARLEKGLGPEGMYNSPAIRQIESALEQTAQGVKFASTKGKSNKELIQAIDTMRRFNSYKTSTISGYKKWRQKVRKAFGVEEGTDESMILRFYNMMLEIDPSLYERFKQHELWQVAQRAMQEGKNPQQAVDELNRGYFERVTDKGILQKIDLETGEILEEIDVETGEIIYDRFDDTEATEIPF